MATGGAMNMHFHNSQPHVTAGSFSSKNAVSIDIDRVHKSFYIDGERLHVLEDISLHVAPGEFLVIVGASGCGKSTLLKLIDGLDRPDAGSIEIGQKLIKGPGLDRGMVFQDHRLLPWLTAEENVAAALIARGVQKAERLNTARIFAACWIDGLRSCISVPTVWRHGSTCRDRSRPRERPARIAAG
jgi:ABC-type glutathione transport system ATPase component